MTITAEEKCRQILAKAGQLQLALLVSSQSRDEFRDILINEASARVLVEFDRAFPNMTHWAKALTEFRKISDTEKASSGFFKFLLGSIFGLAPWCYGVYKLIF